MKHSVYLGVGDRAQSKRRQSPRQDCDRLHPKTTLIQSFEIRAFDEETGALNYYMTSCGECARGACGAEIEKTLKR
eukprot:4617121-Amphidinium_carterae.1